MVAIQHFKEGLWLPKRNRNGTGQGRTGQDRTEQDKKRMSSTRERYK